MHMPICFGILSMPKRELHMTASCVLQMYDLYSRERIDTKADIWVSPVACATWMVFAFFRCDTEMLGRFASEVMSTRLKLLAQPPASHSIHTCFGSHSHFASH